MSVYRKAEEFINEHKNKDFQDYILELAKKYPNENNTGRKVRSFNEAVKQSINFDRAFGVQESNMEAMLRVRNPKWDTIANHLNTLSPRKLRESVLKYYEKQTYAKILFTPDVFHALANAFDWNDTDEGGDFWFKFTNFHG